jgi:hypothetical protein
MNELSNFSIIIFAGLYSLALIAVTSLLTIVLMSRRKPNQKGYRPATEIIVFFDGQKIGDAMDLKVNKQVIVRCTAVDEFKNPAAFDAPPAWSIADQSLGSLTPAADGMSAALVPSGVEGSCDISLSGVSGGSTIVGKGTVNFLAGDAVEIDLSFDAPTDAPAPAAKS